MNENGGYVFISHSHKDIEKVRLLRNLMEENGFEPLCFYLKCLTENDEIEGLIKREIDSREWFVFVNSVNSQNSEWVRKEREYILNLNTKSVITINIDEINEDIVNKIMTSLRVFISYSHRDCEYIIPLKEALMKKDLKVFCDDDLYAGDDFFLSITEKVKEASEFGCVLFLLTKNSLLSEVTQQELSLAKEYNGEIIPIVLANEDLSLYEELPSNLKELQFYYLGENPSAVDYDKCADKVCSILLNKFNN